MNSYHHVLSAGNLSKYNPVANCIIIYDNVKGDDNGPSVVIPSPNPSDLDETDIENERIMCYLDQYCPSILS